MAYAEAEAGNFSQSKAAFQRYQFGSRNLKVTHKQNLTKPVYGI